MKFLKALHSAGATIVLCAALAIGCVAQASFLNQNKARDSNPPAGATAKCRDGTYSFSQHRRGTCSHHGGVEEWLRSDIPN
jgi:uncharacterized protein with FMN-binding domain